MDYLVASLSLLTTEPILFYSVLFLSFLFFGEPIVLSISLLASTTNLFSLSTLLIFAFVSALVAETFWFYVGRFESVRKIFLTKNALKIEGLIIKFHINKPLVLLFTTRMFTGLTIAAIIYLGTKKISFRYFLLYSFIVNAFWTPVVVLIGYLTGHGYNYALTIFNNIHIAAGIVITTLLIIYLIFRRFYRGFSEGLSFSNETKQANIKNR